MCLEGKGVHRAKYYWVVERSTTFIRVSQSSWVGNSEENCCENTDSEVWKKTFSLILQKARQLKPSETFPVVSFILIPRFDFDTTVRPKMIH